MTQFNTIKRLAPAVLLLIILFPARSYSSDETIQPDSWVYPALREFELAGFVTLDPGLPWTRSRVEWYLDRILDRIGSSKRALTPRQEFLLGRLREEFQGMAKRPAEREDRPLWTLREGGRFALLDVSAGTYFRKKKYRDRGELDGVAVPSIIADLGAGLTMVSSYRLEMEPEWDLNSPGDKPSGRERSFRGLTAEYERGYISYSRGRSRVMVGRDWLQWGPARDEGMILSSTAGPLDQIYAETSIGRFRLIMVHAVLDPDMPRRLAGHRLVTRLPRGISLGLSETVLYTGRGIDFSYLLPLGLFYGNQFNERDDDNILWAVDLKVPIRRGLIFYGELLIDDFQYENRGEAPDKVGYDLAVEAMPVVAGRELGLMASYTRIDIYTYSHKEEFVTRYVAGNGDPSMFGLLGSPVGPDSDRWRFRVSWPPFPRLNMEAGFELTRHGEGSDLREWDRVSDPELPFPSGEVVTLRDYYLSGVFDLGKGSFISAGIGLQRVSPDAGDGDRGYGHLGFILDF